MKKSKKGITLVELVLCCAIIVMLGGACTALLMSGNTIFNQSSSTANAQLDSDVLQSYMMNLLPRTNAISQPSLDDAKDLSEGNCIYFDDENDDLFTLRINGEKTTIRSIEEFEYSIVRAGAASSATARAQLLYTVTLTDGTIFSSGFVLSNIKYDESTMSDISGKVSEKPFGFSPIAPDATEPGT